MSLMSEPELTQQEINEAARRHTQTGSRRVAMVAFARGETAADVDNNGTASFVSLPSGKFVVTNHHVYDHFRQQRSNDPNYRMALTGTGFCRPYDISDAELVSENQHLDLCVLRVDEREIEAMGKQFVELEDLSAQSAGDGDEIIIIGFPGMRRTVESVENPDDGNNFEVLRHEAIMLCPTVEGISNDGIRMLFTNPPPTITFFTDRPIDEFRWGGMSGSLVYRVDRDSNRFVPCAILREAGETFQATFYATNINVITRDGSILEPE